MGMHGQYTSDDCIRKFDPALCLIKNFLLCRDFLKVNNLFVIVLNYGSWRRSPLQRPQPIQLTLKFLHDSVVMSAVVGYAYNYCPLLRDRCLL